MKKLNLSRQTIALSLILLLSIFLRLYRIGSTQTFLEDEGRDMLIVKRMLDTKRPVLIGPQTSTGNMYLGPLYYYLITPALILSNMDPVGPAIFIALTGVVSVYLIYLLAKRWFGETPALLSSFMYSIFPMVVSFSRNSWNPNLVPLIVLLIIYVLDKLVFHQVSGSSKSWLTFGGLVGVLVQLHYMALVYVGVVSIIVFIAYFKKIKELLKGFLYALVGFLLVMLPFIVFEFRNNFVNIHAIEKLLFATNEHTIRYSLPLWLYFDKIFKTANTIFGNILTNNFFRVDYLQSVFTNIFLIFSFALLLSQQKQRYNLRPTLLIIVLTFLPLLVLGLYQENIHPHYLSFLFPLVPLAFAALFSNKLLRYPAYIFASIVIIRIFPTTISYINSGPTLQVERPSIIADYLVRESEGQPYNIVSNSSTNTTPYQYFAFLSSNPPSNIQQENVFLICQDQPCEDGDIYNKQIFVRGPSHPTLTNYLGHPLATYVVENPEIISSEHVEMGVWVTHFRLVKDNK